MATITEDYCSKEIYRLLKEKGFDGEVHTTFDEEGYTQPSITLQMAMKWLRKKHCIYISIQPDFVSILHKNCLSVKGHQCYIETYEQACEAAIKYCHENLIK